jgi:hypothetical protein
MQRFSCNNVNIQKNLKINLAWFLLYKITMNKKDLIVCKGAI